MKLTTSLLVFFAATALAGVAEPRAELDDVEAFNVTDVEDPAESFNLEYASFTNPSLSPTHLPSYHHADLHKGSAAAAAATARITRCARATSSPG